MKFAVVQFPGSNCDQDCVHLLRHVFAQPVRMVWHKENTPFQPDETIVLPGGFSYGDYLRCGAIARYSPVMASIKKAADLGQKIIGICNGFQILCEAGLLPGALTRNRDLHFICRHITLRVENDTTPFTRKLQKGQLLNIPIAHGEGRYVADSPVLEKMEANGQIIFRYCNPQGEVSDSANPNGSLRSIAGICNESRNVLGMMPHPERACESILGSVDGRGLWQSLLEFSS